MAGGGIEEEVHRKTNHLEEKAQKGVWQLREREREETLFTKGLFYTGNFHVHYFICVFQ